jgi:hypothetical protein
LVDGKRDLDAVVFHRGQGRRVAEGAVGPVLGIVDGLWFLMIPVIILMQSKSDPRRPVVPEALIVIGIIGWLTIGGCIGRLRKRVSG